MTVITISRGAFSGGKRLAECLSKRLGYRFIGRDVIIQAASEFGIPEGKLLEAIEQKQGIKERIGMEVNKFHYLSFVQAALCEEAKDDNIVYHGNGGHILLKGISHVIKVKMNAGMEQRVMFAMERLKFTREEAVAYINNMDEVRNKWAKILYGEDWDDPAQYDIIVDLKSMTIPDACEVIADMTKSPQFQITAESRKAMEDLLLASREKQQLHKTMLQK
jgi:cytidylate kinase